MASHKDLKMQDLYPEGFVFLNAIYGLAWCNFVQRLGTSSELRKEGLEEIQKSWRKVNSDLGRTPFTEDLPIPYGAFYAGWSNYLLGRKLSLEQTHLRDTNEVAHFKSVCETIESALTEKPFPVTYNGLAWPADVVICVAALSIHDKILQPRYARTIQNWLVDIQKHVDRYGLLPHEVGALNGQVVENARGSSQSLMLLFLKDIDPDFGAKQFSIYRENFLSHRIGITGIREYPRDSSGLGDVDSGPTFLQFGSAATIVGFQTFYKYGDWQTATIMRNIVEAAAIPIANGDSKSYLFGALPIADAFITWGHSAESNEKMEFPVSFIWCHGVSLSVAILLCLITYYLVKSLKPASRASS